MTFKSAIPELFDRFPDLQAKYQSELAYLADEEPLAYVVFGDILVPSIEAALNRGDTNRISALCEYLEDLAVSKDPRLDDLLAIEIGEWLGFAAIADQFATFMGKETKRICGYLPGLAEQRRLQKGLG